MGRDPKDTKSDRDRYNAIALLDMLHAWDAIKLGEMMRGASAGGVELDAVRIKRTDGGDSPLLMVITAVDHEGTPIVGFQAGSEPIEMMASAVRRIRNGTLKWKLDTYRAGAGN
jgi:hypothetical protein